VPWGDAEFGFEINELDRGLGALWASWPDARGSRVIPHASAASEAAPPAALIDASPSTFETPTVPDKRAPPEAP